MKRYSFCRICKNYGENVSYRLKEMQLGLRDEFTYIECSNCACLQINEYPPDLSKYYPKNYYSFSSALIPSSSIKMKLKQFRDRHLLFGNNWLGFLYGLYKPSPESKTLNLLRNIHRDAAILDVGCGQGIFLRNLEQLGFRNLLGVDPFIPKTIGLPLGGKILKQHFYDTHHLHDVILMQHSLEHMPDQIQVFQHLSKVLAPNGFIIIRIPLSSSFAWEHYREYWYQLDAPRHFYLHSQKSLRLLANLAKLHVTDIVYDSNENQFLMSELFSKNISSQEYENRTSPFFSTADLKKFRVRAEHLNMQERGDQAIFVLRHQCP